MTQKVKAQTKAEAKAARAAELAERKLAAEQRMTEFLGTLDEGIATGLRTLADASLTDAYDALLQQEFTKAGVTRRAALQNLNVSDLNTLLDHRQTVTIVCSRETEKGEKRPVFAPKRTLPEELRSSMHNGFVKLSLSMLGDNADLWYAFVTRAFSDDRAGFTVSNRQTREVPFLSTLAELRALAWSRNPHRVNGFTNDGTLIETADATPEQKQNA